MLGVLHARTSAWVNRLDNRPGRQIWHNFWETRLTFQRSYLTRLQYVHENPVRHGLVPVAAQYPWCSASWFMRTASASQIKNLGKLKSDRIMVRDEFKPVWEGFERS